MKLAMIPLLLASMSVGAQQVNTNPIDVLPPPTGVVMNPVFGAPPPLDGTTVNPPTANNCPILGCGDKSAKIITKAPVDTPPPSTNTTNDEPVKVVEVPSPAPVVVQTPRIETPRIETPRIETPVVAPIILNGIHAASLSVLPQATQRLGQSVQSRLDNYPSTNGAWGEIVYQHGERSSNNGVGGLNSNLYQVVAGADIYSDTTTGLKLGGGLALSNTAVNVTNGNSTIQQGSLFVYGKMPVLQDYVLDGMASVGLSSTNLSSNGFSNKSVMGNDAMVSVGISRPFEYSEVRIAPYARLSYQYVGQESYDTAAFKISGFGGSAVRGVVGVAVGSLNKDPLKDAYTYRANIGVGADSQGLLNPTLNTTLGGLSNSVTTPTAGSTFVQAGLYGTVKVTNNAYAYAGVSVEARTSQTLYGGSVGFRVVF